MDAFPAFVPLGGAQIVVVGEGEAADAKARLFEGSPAALVRLPASKAMERACYRGARLVFVALDGEAAASAAELARAAGALVNVVDRPELSDFYTPALVDRGAVVGAIGTAGTAPLLGSRLRAELETRWPEGLGRVAALSAALRDELRAALPDAGARRAALRRILDGPASEAALAGDMTEALALARQAIVEPRAPGKVTRIIAPDDPEDLTLRQVRTLSRADRLVVDGVVDPAVLAHARRDAPRATAASEAELRGWAGAGEAVVVISGDKQRAGEATG